MATRRKIKKERDVRALCLELKQAQSERLVGRCRLVRGKSYRVHLAEGLEVEPKRFADSPVESLELHWSAQGFEIKTSYPCELWSGEEKLLPFHRNLHLKRSMRWPKLPSRLSMQFENGVRLDFVPEAEPQAWWQISSQQVALLMALILHLSLFSGLPQLFPSQEIQEEKEEVADLQGVEVRVANLSPKPPSRLGPPSSQALDAPVEFEEPSEEELEAQRQKEMLDQWDLEGESDFDGEAQRAKDDSQALADARWSSKWRESQESVELEQSETSVSLSEVEGGIRALRSEFQRCYERALILEPQLSGVLQMYIRVSRTGVFEDLRFESHPTQRQRTEDELYECLSQAFGGADLPESERGFNLRYRLSFGGSSV